MTSSAYVPKGAEMRVIKAQLLMISGRVNIAVVRCHGVEWFSRTTDSG